MASFSVQYLFNFAVQNLGALNQISGAAQKAAGGMGAAGGAATSMVGALGQVAANAAKAGAGLLGMGRDAQAAANMMKTASVAATNMQAATSKMVNPAVTVAMGKEADRQAKLYNDTITRAQARSDFKKQQGGGDGGTTVLGWGGKLMTGYIGYQAGKAVMHGADKAFSTAAEYDTTLARMRQAGVAPNDVADAEAKSWEMSRKYGNISAPKVLELLNDSRLILGSQHTANKDADIFASAASFMAAYSAKGGKHHLNNSADVARETIALVKSAEIAGLTDPAAIKEHVNEVMKSIVASGGQVTAQQYLQAQRAAGISYMTMDKDMRYGTFPAMVQEFGPGAGVMAMTGFNKIVANVMNRSYSLKAMEDAGLLIGAEHSKGGMPKPNTGTIAGSDLAASNRLQWVMDYLMPAAAKLAGVKDLNNVSDQDFIALSKAVAKMFPDRNVSKEEMEMFRQYPRLKKVADFQKQVDEDWSKFDTYGKAKQSFGAAMDNLFTQMFGGDMLATTAKGISGLAGAIQSLSSAVAAVKSGPLGKFFPSDMASKGVGLLGGGINGTDAVAFKELRRSWFPGGPDDSKKAFDVIAMREPARLQNGLVSGGSLLDFQIPVSKVGVDAALANQARAQRDAVGSPQAQFPGPYRDYGNPTPQEPSMLERWLPRWDSKPIDTNPWAGAATPAFPVPDSGVNAASLPQSVTVTTDVQARFDPATVTVNVTGTVNGPVAGSGQAQLSASGRGTASSNVGAGGGGAALPP